MKIYLDDKKEIPAGWTGVRTSAEFKRMIVEAFEHKTPIEAISFDNDLGEPTEGHHLLQWLADTYPEFLLGETELMAHSQNRPERDAMTASIESYKRNREIILEYMQKLRSKPEEIGGEMKMR